MEEKTCEKVEEKEKKDARKIKVKQGGGDDLDLVMYSTVNVNNGDGWTEFPFIFDLYCIYPIIASVIT